MLTVWEWTPLGSSVGFLGEDGLAGIEAWPRGTWGKKLTLATRHPITYPCIQYNHLTNVHTTVMSYNITSVHTKHEMTARRKMEYAWVERSEIAASVYDFIVSRSDLNCQYVAFRWVSIVRVASHARVASRDVTERLPDWMLFVNA